MEIDKKKIKDKIRELKNESSGDNWISIDGMQALTRAENKNSRWEFNPTSGIILKSFFNLRTGEIKIFPLQIFEKDE